MTGPTVRFRASFRTARRSSSNGHDPLAATEPTKKEEKGTGPCRAARLLALAHHVERQIEAGTFRGYGDAARHIGMTAGRMTQVMNLLLLAPDIQARLFTGDLRCGERRMRQAVSAPLLENERALVSRSA